MREEKEQIIPGPCTFNFPCIKCHDKCQEAYDALLARVAGLEKKLEGKE